MLWLLAQGVVNEDMFSVNGKSGNNKQGFLTQTKINTFSDLLKKN